MKCGWILGLGWLILVTACDDRHVVGEPIAIEGQAGSQAGTTTVMASYGGTQSGNGGASAVATGGGSTTSGMSSTGGSSSLATGGSDYAAGGVSSTGESAAAGATSALGTGGNLPTTGGAVSTGSTAALATGGAISAGGTTALATGGAVSTGSTTALATGGALSSGGTTALATGGALFTGGVASTGGSGTSASSCIVYVATSGNDSNSGNRWSSAFANVQPAITTGTNLVSAGTCSAVEVWVAAGKYKPTYLTDASDPRTATFQLAANVALYGGFVGTETARSVRDIATNVTTLSGDIGTANDETDNSYHVVTGATGATLDGLTITGGNAEGYGNTTPVLAGGGMYNQSASPVVANCTFSGNSANDYGGGMYNSGSSPTVTNCTFSGNSVFYGGGGMANDSSSPTVTNCTFSDNSASSVGAGGGMYNSGSSPTVTNCTFSGNSAAQGGGMHNADSSPTISNCSFSGNSARNDFGDGEGGGMYNSGSSPTVTNCTFSGNSANGDGGGMANGGSSPTVTNCTFSGNSYGAMVNRTSSPTVTNCIFWDDIFWGATNPSGPEIWDDVYSSPTVTYSIVGGGYPGTGNLSSDPLLNSDLTLQKGSPAIDAGGCGSNVTVTDILGNPRWDIASVTNVTGGNGVDIGAYEYQGTAGTDTLMTSAVCQ